MHLLQFSQSIDSPSEIYVAFQRDPLLWPSLPPPQEGHGDTRVLGQMPSDPLRCTSASKSHIHRQTSLKYHTPDLNHQHRPLSCLQFFLKFIILSTTPSVNLRSKCSEKKRSEKRGELGDDEEGGWGGGIERKKKHKCRTKQPSWSTFATGSQ